MQDTMTNDCIIVLRGSQDIFPSIRVVKGPPTLCRKPPAHQKWAQNWRAGGGAVVPCSWFLRVSQREKAERVAAVIRARLPDVEGHEDMEVKILN